MARHFNGTSQWGAFPWHQFIATISVSAWIWRDGTTANRILLESNGGGTFPQDGSWDIIANQSVGVDLIRQEDANGHQWADSYPIPSTGAWHHHLWVMTNSVSNQVWIDGVAQTLTTVGHQTLNGLFRGSPATVSVANRNSGTLFWAGKIAELALWTNTALATKHAKALTAGASPWEVAPFAGGSFSNGIDLYFPLLGRVSPEPNASGWPDGAPTQRKMTLTGTPTIVNHPGCRPHRRFGGAF